MWHYFIQLFNIYNILKEGHLELKNQTRKFGAARPFLKILVITKYFTQRHHYHP